MSILPSRVRLFDRCPACDGVVQVPPGVYYQDEPYHAACAEILKAQDYSDEVLSPGFEQLQEALEEILDVDSASSPWDL